MSNGSDKEYDPPTCDCGSDNMYEMGFIPANVVMGGDFDILWVHAHVCEDCGSFAVREVEEDDMVQAEEEYVQVLIDNDLTDANTVEEALE